MFPGPLRSFVALSPFGDRAFDSLFAQPLIFSWLEQHWNAARRELAASPARGFILVIDEIQKVPVWSETVKKLWDEDARAGLALQSFGKIKIMSPDEYLRRFKKKHFSLF